MHRHIDKAALAALLVLALASGAWSAVAAEDATKNDDSVTSAAETKVSITANDSKLTDLIESLAKQSKQKIIAESTVKGTLPSLSLTDVTLESALSALCKAGKLEWRKVCIAQDSKLLEQPDKFAATVRLLGGLSFPNIVLAGSSTGKTALHLTDAKYVARAQETLSEQLSLPPVYLVTNDTAAAAKTLVDDRGNEKPDTTAVDRFADLSKSQIDMFMKMTPEEREQALMAGINLMDQVDPSYMSTVMQTLLNSDQEHLKRMMSRQTEAFFHMPDDQRRAMIRMNMKAASTFTPEQMKILQEDARIVAEEMKAESGN